MKSHLPKSDAFFHGYPCCLNLRISKHPSDYSAENKRIHAARIKNCSLSRRNSTVDLIFTIHFKGPSALTETFLNDSGKLLTFSENFFPSKLQAKLLTLVSSFPQTSLPLLCGRHYYTSTCILFAIFPVT